MTSLIAKAPNDTDPLNSPNHNTQHGYIADAINLGWVTINTTMVYSSADDPTYVMKTDDDVNLTGEIGVGMKIKITQSTGGIKFFIITKINYNSDVANRTAITMYGGTDFDLVNEAISSPCYSTAKAPLGFPLSQDKWSIETTDTTRRDQASATAGTWYNLGSLNISVPIGVWDTWYSCSLGGSRATPGSGFGELYSTLSTANNSESDADFTSGGGFYLVPSDTGWGGNINNCQRKFLAVTTKTTYYWNHRQITATAAFDTLSMRNDLAKAKLRITCAYL